VSKGVRDWKKRKTKNKTKQNKTKQNKNKKPREIVKGVVIWGLIGIYLDLDSNLNIYP
jgi:F0F1-type ATP synthase assembly protein I